MNSESVESELMKELKPILLQSPEQLGKFWETYRKNNGIASQNKKTEGITAQMMAKQMQKEVGAGTEIPAGVESNGETVATGKLSIKETVGKRKEGYLGFLTVNQEYQGKGIAGDVVETLLHAAKQKECFRVVAEVLVENTSGSRSLGSLFKNGFLLESIAEGNIEEAGKFVLAKSFEEDIVPESDQKDPLIEKVPVTDVEKIKELLSQGYKGIKLLRAGEDQFSLELQRYGH